ncbi:MAG TPA: hypothetical protein VGF24_13745 [Vicinamibacterales bacterium]|jgi:hypothetical protein
MALDNPNALQNPGVAVNPSADEVLSEVAAKIKYSCQPTPIDQDAIDDWMQTYQRPFSVRLSVALWNDEKANVLSAAEQHGIIAKAIASLRDKRSVDVEVMRAASAVVVEHCRKRFGAVGVWCS